MWLFATTLTAQAVLLPFLCLYFLFLPDDSIVNYNGESVAIGSVRLKIFAMFGIWFAFAAYLGPQLRKGRRRARDVLFGTLLVSAFVDLVLTVIDYRDTPGALALSTMMLAINALLCGISGWYLYRKENVRAFFGGGSTPFVSFK